MGALPASQVQDQLFEVGHVAAHVEEHLVEQIAFGVVVAGSVGGRASGVHQHGQAAGLVGGQVPAQAAGIHLTVRFQHRHLLGHVLELADVAGEPEPLQFLHRLGRQADGFHPVAVGKIGRKLPEQ